MDGYTPDGSGTVTINICDSNGNIINTFYKNLSEIAVAEDDDGNTELQTSH